MRSELRVRAGCASGLLLLWLFASPLALTGNAFPPQSSHSAKQPYALIYGTVWGPDDHPVAGVPIKMRRSGDKKPKWELVSNSTGEFAQRVPAGTDDYIIVADVKVAKGQTKPEITVHIDDDERKDVSLHLTQQQLPK